MSERKLPAWLPTAGTALALAALIAWSFSQRWAVLSSSPFPLGIDGYFYPVQLRSLLEHGELQYPSSPLAFWLLAPFAWATDPITGAKLGAAVLGALVALPAYSIGAQLGRDGDRPGRGAGLVCAAIATSSAGSMYLTLEFVKNGIGITVALTALWLVLRAIEQPSRARVVLALLGLAASVIAHKMAAALVIGIAIPAALVEARSHHRVSTSADEVPPAHGSLVRYRGWLIAGTLVLIVATIAIGAVAPQRFLSLGDVRLLDGLFTSSPDFELPALSNHLYLQHEPLIGVIVALLAIVALVIDDRRARPALRVTAWCSIGLALVIGIPWLDAGHTQGLTLRLRAIAWVPLALNASVIVRLGLRHAVRRFAGDRVPPPALLGGALATVIVLAHVGGGLRDEGVIPTHPALVSSAYALADRLPADAVAIVPERHIAFMIAWYARVPVSLRPESTDQARRWRVLPLSYISRGDTLDDALIEIRARTDLPRILGLHPHHPNGMVAVPEPTWRALLERMPARDRAMFTAWPTL